MKTFQGYHLIKPEDPEAIFIFALYQLRAVFLIPGLFQCASTGLSLPQPQFP
jgi:hypothetical protein